MNQALRAKGMNPVEGGDVSVAIWKARIDAQVALIAARSALEVAAINPSAGVAAATVAGEKVGGA